MEMSTNLCEGGGIPAESEYLFFHRSGGFDGNPSYPEFYCDGGGAQDLIDFIHTILTSCPNRSQLIEDDYYDERIKKINYCSVDSVTGKKCGEVMKEGYGFFHEPYSQWDPDKCSSSCIAEYDQVYREKYKDRKLEYCSSSMLYFGCQLFITSENPLSMCGTEYIPKEEDVNTIRNMNVYAEDEGNASSATTLSSHVALLSLIMCIIFAFFK